MANKEQARAKTWREVQESLKACKGSAEVLDLIKAEAKGEARPLFISRMHGRFRVLRTAEDDAMITRLIVSNVGG